MLLPQVLTLSGGKLNLLLSIVFVAVQKVKQMSDNEDADSTIHFNALQLVNLCIRFRAESFNN